VILLVTCAFVSGSARGDTGRGRWELGASANYGWIVFSQQDEPSGYGAGLHLRYGISESFSVKLGVLWTAHDLEANEDRPAGWFQIVSADLGLTYAIDLVRFSPKIEAGLGILQRRFAGSSATDLGVKIGLAGDYHLSPRVTVGFGIYYHGFLTDLGNIPVYVEMGPRFSFQWGGASR
jgi:hypothetical protein